MRDWEKSEDIFGKEKSVKMEKPNKQQKKEKLRTFKIYKHVDRLKQIYESKMAKVQEKG